MTDPTQAIVERALDQAAEGWMVGHIDRAYWLWDHLNWRCFDGRLSTPLIRLQLPHRGVERHAFADIGPTDEAGASLAVRIHPELVRGTSPRYSHTLDSYLLHEMVHAWQVEVLGWPWGPDLDWHGPGFRLKEAETTRAWSLDPARLSR
jgi:hypothetical protein